MRPLEVLEADILWVGDDADGNVLAFGVIAGGAGGAGVIEWLIFLVFTTPSRKERKNDNSVLAILGCVPVKTSEAPAKMQRSLDFAPTFE